MPRARHGNRARRKWEGTLSTSIARYLSVLIFLSVGALLFAQESQTGESSSGGSFTPVDETTLLLEAPAGNDGQAAGVSPFGIWDLVRMIIVLAAVIGVVYAVFYLLKRGSRGRFVQNDSIRIIGSQVLPGNKSMHLVEVGSQIFLVGSAGDAVNLISEITDKETIDAMVLRTGNSRRVRDAVSLNSWRAYSAARKVSLLDSCVNSARDFSG